MSEGHLAARAARGGRGPSSTRRARATSRPSRASTLGGSVAHTLSYSSRRHRARRATGGIARAGRAQCGLLTRRAKATSARDRTTYGRARNSTRLFYLHHTRLIAKAAVINDAMGIREQVQGLRQRVCAAHAAASGWP